MPKKLSKLDIYSSNYGNGPLLAKIIRIGKRKVKMMRWVPMSSRRSIPKSGQRNRPKIFVLPIAFLASESCGWKLISESKWQRPPRKRGKLAKIEQEPAE